MPYSHAPKHGHKLSRRHWLQLAGCAAATLLSSSCGLAQTTSQATTELAEEGTASISTATTPPDVMSSPTTATATVQELTPSQPNEPTLQPVAPEPTLPALDTAATPVPATAPPAPVDPPPTQVVLATLDSLERRIAQMLLVGFRGLAINDDYPIARDIRDYGLGGVVLFDSDVPTNNPVRNIQSPQQVKQLVAALQALAAIPLLVAIDQEGGKVARLQEKAGFGPTMSAQALGTTGDLALTQREASATAKQLAALGINFNLAPVVDLNRNPFNPVIGQLERSYSDDPAIVIQHAREFITAHHAEGLVCALKHFPGHGSSTGDTHLGVVDVTQTWSRTELEPFAALIKAGLADTIMTAHVFNAGLDPDYPATLSRATIADLLRGELGYDGVVLCDDLQMGAIRTQFGFEESLRLALASGADILTFANNTLWEDDVTERAVATIQRLVQQGTISAARIDQSYERIQRLKGRLRSRGQSTP